MENTRKSLGPWVTGLIFCLIVLIAGAMRLYKLNEIPPGVNRDEASIGYTAYSLLTTGNDEYGRRFPLSFQSFGDWKLPLYIYTTIPFVRILGPTELAIRLPSALAGIFTVAILFFLVREIFLTDRFSLIASALLAISPWHVHLSRVESESNFAVMFTSIAFLLFLKGMRKHRLLPLSAFFWSLPYYTYHGSHITSTLLLAGLMVLYWRNIPKDRYGLVSLVVLSALPLFMLSQTLLGADKTKLSGISIFGDPAVIHEKIEIPRNKLSNPNSLWARLRYNRVFFAIDTIFRNYLKSFSPEFLFIRGGTNRAHNIQNFGNLYIAEALFFYLGIILLFAHRRDKNMRFLLFWLLISPIAASITKDAPHTNRMFAIYPLPPILTALGVTWMTKKFQNGSDGNSGKFSILPGVRIKVVVFVISAAFAANFLVYLNRYFVQFPKEEAQYWGYGYKKLAALLSTPAFSDKHVIVAKPEFSPYIFLLLYTQFDPATYQKTAIRYPPTPDAFIHVKAFGRYEFRDINWESDLFLPNTVLVDYTETIPEAVRTRGHKEQIFLPNGAPFLTLIET